MSNPVVIPNLGLVEEVILLEWLVMDGATVSEGAPIAVVETEKAQVEIRAPVSGRLTVAVSPSDDPIAIETVLGHVNAEDH